ncbi:MAG: transposase [Steroidobacteraceae bacterium]
MNTSEQAVSIGRRRRRRHSAEFRAEAVRACQQPGVSVAAIALARGLNANLLRRWVLKAERGTLLVPSRSSAPSAPVENAGGFVPVKISPAATEAAIRIEVRRGSSTVNIEWPSSTAHECSLLLRELMR